MPSEIHGTKRDPAKHHPVFDLAHWQRQFPLGDDRSEGGWIDGPGDLARVEQARSLARPKSDEGRPVPVDVFVWSDGRDYQQPWLTQLGGVPWRERRKKWPRDESGQLRTFLGQMCFLDSKDLVPFSLPGDVALIFGGGAFADQVSELHLEWSSLYLDDPLEYLAPRSLPFRYQGVVHRTVQFTDATALEPAFVAAGFKDGGFGIGAMQATSIGTYASLPQGWPFREGDGNTLICTLSSFYFRGEWPLCDVPASVTTRYADGRHGEAGANDALSLGIGDAGALWIYRDRKGKFHLDGACG